LALLSYSWLTRNRDACKAVSSAPNLPQHVRGRKGPFGGSADPAIPDAVAVTQASNLICAKLLCEATYWISASRSHQVKFTLPV
jgi:hypothetical protein